MYEETHIDMRNKNSNTTPNWHFSNQAQTFHVHKIWPPYWPQLAKGNAHSQRGLSQLQA